MRARARPQAAACKLSLLTLARTACSQDQNYRPLHWASYKSDHAECAQLLVDAGADPNVTTARGFTPLQLAHGQNSNVSSKPGVAAVLEEAARHPRQPWQPANGAPQPPPADEAPPTGHQDPAPEAPEAPTPTAEAGGNAAPESPPAAIANLPPQPDGRRLSIRALLSAERLPSADAATSSPVAPPPTTLDSRKRLGPKTVRAAAVMGVAAATAAVLWRSFEDAGAALDASDDNGTETVFDALEARPSADRSSLIFALSVVAGLGIGRIPLVQSTIAAVVARVRARFAPVMRRSASLPPQFLCPITGEVMRDPVTTCDGHAFERAAIERWLTTHRTSPMTGMLLETTALTPAIALRQLIDQTVDSIKGPRSPTLLERSSSWSR